MLSFWVRKGDLQGDPWRKSWATHSAPEIVGEIEGGLALTHHGWLTTTRCEPVTSSLKLWYLPFLLMQLGLSMYIRKNGLLYNQHYCGGYPSPPRN